MSYAGKYGFPGKDAPIWWWSVPFLCAAILWVALPFGFALSLGTHTVGLPFVISTFWVVILLGLAKLLEWSKTKKSDLIYAIPIWIGYVLMVIVTALFALLFLYNMSDAANSQAKMKKDEYTAVIEMLGKNDNSHRSFQKVLATEDVCEEIENIRELQESWSSKSDVYVKKSNVKNLFQPLNLLEGVNVSLENEKKDIARIIKPCLSTITNFDLNDYKNIKGEPCLSVGCAFSNAPLRGIVLIGLIAFAFLLPFLGAAPFLQTLS
ncbi:MAG: hypothetical protein AAGA77_21790 [Bacteroidota bacterium]